jgi:hypothetical protein
VRQVWLDRLWRGEARLGSFGWVGLGEVRQVWSGKARLGEVRLGRCGRAGCVWGWLGTVWRGR